MYRLMLIAFWLLIISCKEDRGDNDDDYYKIINDLINERSADYDCFVVFEPIKFQEDDRKFGEDGDIIARPPDEINYHRPLNILLKEKLISIEEAKYMYEHQDINLNYFLDSTKLKTKTIKSYELEKRIFWSNNSNEKFFGVSYPLFNEEQTKILITLFEVVGRKGQSNYYMFQKVNGEWILREKMYNYSW